MGETKKDEGLITEWAEKNNRLTFKINGKTYACFLGTDVGDKANEFMRENANRTFEIDYYDHEKDGRTYHNCTAIKLSENQVQGESVEVVSNDRAISTDTSIKRQVYLKVAATLLAGYSNAPDKLVNTAKGIEKECEGWL